MSHGGKGKRSVKKVSRAIGMALTQSRNYLKGVRTKNYLLLAKNDELALFFSTDLRIRIRRD